jgi:DNA-binding transcriptional regulator YiaG
MMTRTELVQIRVEVFGVTPEQFAAMLGISTMTLYRYETGRAPIPTKIERYVRALATLKELGKLEVNEPVVIKE